MQKNVSYFFLINIPNSSLLSEVFATFPWALYKNSPLFSRFSPYFPQENCYFSDSFTLFFIGKTFVQKKTPNENWVSVSFFRIISSY